MLFCSRLLSSRKICLQEMWRGEGKERGGEAPEGIRPVHGWQRRRGGCMDITPDWWIRRPSLFSTTSGWSLPCSISWCRQLAMDREARYQHEECATTWLPFRFILPRMRPECVECCWNAVRISRKELQCSYVIYYCLLCFYTLTLCVCVCHTK